MTTTTNIKDRCRLCYTLLRDSSLLHHKVWCAKDHHRIYNIYQRRPHRYRDLIVRYLCIHLPENENSPSTDQYSRVVCGKCANSLDKLDQAFRTIHQTRKSLRTKFRKTSQIVHYQLDRQRLNSNSTQISSNHRSSIETSKVDDIDRINPPKRASKRKGEPKHIDQTINNNLKTNAVNALQLIVKLPEETNESPKDRSTSNLRTSPRRKTFQQNNTNEIEVEKKKFKPTNDEQKPNKIVNFLKSNVLTDIPVNNQSATLQNLSSNRTVNSAKGNHIERIAISLLSVSRGTMISFLSLKA